MARMLVVTYDTTRLTQEQLDHLINAAIGQAESEGLPDDNVPPYQATVSYTTVGVPERVLCPVCAGPSIECAVLGAPAIALDRQCTACGWFFSSRMRAVDLVRRW